MDSEITRIFDELKTQVRLANRLEAQLERKLIRKHDDESTVTAVVNGGARLVDLIIDDSALVMPAKLGSSITVAINRARNVSLRFREAAREKYLPGDASCQLVDKTFSAHLETSDFEMVEIDGSWSEYNRIAEGVEAYNEIVDLKKYFKRLRIKQEIGNGGGVVTVSVDGSYLDVEVQDGVPRRIGLERLSRQTVEAVHRAEGNAAQVRRQKLEQITVNGVSAGERVQKARRFGAELT